MGVLSRLGRVTRRVVKDKVDSVFGSDGEPEDDEADAILAAEEAREAAARRPAPAAPPPAVIPQVPATPPAGPPPTPGPSGRRL